MHNITGTGRKKVLTTSAESRIAQSMVKKISLRSASVRSFLRAGRRSSRACPRPKWERLTFCVESRSNAQMMFGSRSTFGF